MIKHLQLNTALLKDGDSILQYIQDNGIDFACLQEIVYPLDQENYFAHKVREQGLHYQEGIHFKYLPKNENLSIAVVSKYPIVDTVKLYWNRALLHK